MIRDSKDVARMDASVWLLAVILPDSANLLVSQANSRGLTTRSSTALTRKQQVFPNSIHTSTSWLLTPVTPATPARDALKTDECLWADPTNTAQENNLFKCKIWINL